VEAPVSVVVVLPRAAVGETGASDTVMIVRNPLLWYSDRDGVGDGDGSSLREMCEGCGSFIKRMWLIAMRWKKGTIPYLSLS